MAAAFFVTRAKRGMDFGVRGRLAVPPGGPVTHDQLIRMRGPKTRTLYPDTLRRIRFVDPVTGKRLTFLTNNLTLAAADVAMLYRKRWRIELSFKWMKQHLRIKAFLRHVAGRGADATVDRGDRLRAGTPAEAAARAPADTERNRPGPERGRVRENPSKSSVLRAPRTKRGITRP